MRKTEIHPYTSEWVKQFEEEVQLLPDVFKDELIGIHHIGSTSIPTIGFAKPIIDILIVVRNINKVDAFNPKMMALGYNPRGENGISGRRYFTKGISKRTHHLHIYQEGNEYITKHLVFKEYLRQHPEDAKGYGQLKIQLAHQFPEDHHQYQNGKEAFVNELMEKAVAWHNCTTSSEK